MRALTLGGGVFLVILIGAVLAPHSRAQLGGQGRPDPAAAMPLATGTTATLATTFIDTGARKTERIDSSLDHLFRVDAAARATGGPVTAAALASSGPADLVGLIAAHQLRLEDAGRVQVWAQAGDNVTTASADLAALGMQVQRVDAGQKLVQGLLPIAALQQAAALSSVVDVRRPDYGVVATGSVDTQGDTILNAQTLRNTLTASGRGVKVGVISDGMEGLASSQATSDLGPVDVTTCNVVSGTPSPTATGAGAEGTAMSEIVHDIAPDAQIIFGYFGINLPSGGTSLDFNAAVSCLAQHTAVSVDDVGWFNTGPYDGTSAVSQNTSNALNNVANPIRGYYTAVANQARNHYHATFASSGFQFTNPGNPADFWVLNQFSASATTTDGGFGLVCAAGVFCGDTVQIAPGGTLTVLLEWNDPFNGSSNDYDLLVQDNFLHQILIPPQNRQNGTPGSHPTEEFSLQNTHGVSTVYSIIIGNYKGLVVAPRALDMYILCSCNAGFVTGLPAPDNIALHNFNTLSGSVPNQSDASGGVISVGAAGASTPGTIESYSSRGPTADGRTKPDITGIDCVAITGAAGFPNPFCGSSAAAPHIAGIAALLLSCNPTLLTGLLGSVPAATARTTLQTALLNGATDLGPPGVDNTYGHGRANTTASEPLANCKDTDGDGYPDGLETTLGKSPTTYCGIMRADVDGDGQVTIVDLGLLAQDFLQSVPPAPPRFDQDGNNSIDIVDIAIAAQFFLQTVSLCP